MPSTLALSKKSRRFCSILFLVSDIWAPWRLQDGRCAFGLSLSQRTRLFPVFLTLVRSTRSITNVNILQHFSAGHQISRARQGFGQLDNRTDRGDRCSAQHELAGELQGAALAPRSAVGIPDRF